MRRRAPPLGHVRLATAAVVVAAAGALAAATWRSVLPGTPCAPWLACAEASSLREAIERAGATVAGDTGSAWIVRNGRDEFLAWSTRPPAGEPLRVHGYAVAGVIDGTEILGDGVRLSWTSPARRVWIQRGPSSLGPLPSVESLRALVRHTR